MDSTHIVCQKCGQVAGASYSFSRDVENLFGMIDRETKLKTISLCDECASNLFEVTIIPDDKPDATAQALNKISQNTELVSEKLLAERRRYTKSIIVLAIFEIILMAAIIVMTVLVGKGLLGKGWLLFIYLSVPVFLLGIIVIALKLTRRDSVNKEYDKCRNKLAFAKRISGRKYG